jgi:predicted ATPase
LVKCCIEPTRWTDLARSQFDLEAIMIHRIRVQNFKSIIDVTVDLSAVTVIVGKSGTGKSNFIQSLRLLRDVLSAHPQYLQVLQQNWPQFRPATMSDGSPSFELEFSVAGIDERFKYKLSLWQQMGQLPGEERLDLGNKCLFHQSFGQAGQQPNTPRWIVEPATLPALQAGPIALGRIPSISEVVIAFTVLTSGIGCYAFSDDVLRSGNPQMQGSQQFTRGLDDTGTNYLSVLKEIVSNLQDLKVRKSIVGALQRVNPLVSSAELDNIHQPQRVVVGHKFDGKTLSLELSQESDGFRRFYAHLLALYQRPPKQTLMFEHPEDGIHPGALSLLAEEFKAAPQQGRGQVILTTHSPKLLDHFDAEEIRVVELDGFRTRIGPVSTEQKEAIHEKLLDPGELLTVDPARMQLEATGS